MPGHVNGAVIEEKAGIHCRVNPPIYRDFDTPVNSEFAFDKLVLTAVFASSKYTGLWQRMNEWMAPLGRAFSTVLALSRALDHSHSRTALDCGNTQHHQAPAYFSSQCVRRLYWKPAPFRRVHPVHAASAGRGGRTTDDSLLVPL
eukprot:COSAG02_NODE_2050_length_10003_cov_585.950525_2_plen_145_part_00